MIVILTHVPPENASTHHAFQDVSDFYACLLHASFERIVDNQIFCWRTCSL